MKAPNGRSDSVKIIGNYKMIYTHDGSTHAWWELINTKTGEKICNPQTKDTADFIMETLSKLHS